jgi:hypothetical protein
MAMTRDELKALINECKKMRQTGRTSFDIEAHKEQVLSAAQKGKGGDDDTRRNS